MTEIVIARLLKSNDVLTRKLAFKTDALSSPEVHYLFGLPLNEVARIIDEYRSPVVATEPANEQLLIMAAEEQQARKAADAKVTHLETHIEGTAKDTHKLLIAADTELATLRAKNERLTGALTIAANRLQRCSVDYDTGTRKFIEVGEWAEEARAAITEGTAP